MNIYSPIQQIRFKNYQNIDVKRDDLIDPYISGNKWRKLKYVLEDASNQQKKHLVTFGGAYSNHLLATAAAASRFGFKSTAFVRGDQVENETLLLCKLFGMRLIFISRGSYLNKQALFTLHFEKDKDAYFIDEGGAGLLATKGCAEIIAELPQPYTHLFCAAGTGTTASGLLRGLQQYHPNTQLHVIPVLKGGDFIKDEIAKYHENLTGLHIHTDYHFGGYAKTTTELLTFMKDFIQETGLLIDPVYTAKMMYAIYDLQQQNYFKENDQILALHTGGLNGIFGKKEKISQILM
ncbi:1-aminocyclopropane-1-carboxylate deaminase/D-cysteine desulfhydrase [Pedobacter sp.]|uniref:1-aminocyclopropane-1-carboxylate deaminase/D-cysteine desulfhydrase n=1 Tax=Pedobacter sp. TaxID=1411316 RepID=UPI00396C59F9